MEPAVLALILGAGPAFATYYLTALGHGLFEKSGVLNLAIDGVFTLGVAVAYAAAVLGYNPNVGSLVAIIVAALFGLLIAFLSTKLPISHGAIGLSIMFVGYGMASLVGVPIRSQTPVMVTYPMSASFYAGLLVISVLIGIAVHLMLTKTKLGAAIRAAGENPHAASALGVNVLKVRLIAGGIGYALIGLGSALYVLAYTQSWAEGVGMGHGWIAFAVSLSAGRHPIATIIAAAIFAGLLNYRYVLQGYFGISPHITNMIPYIAALAAMVIFMVTPLHRKLAPPRALGKIYFKEERTV